MMWIMMEAVLMFFCINLIFSKHPMILSMGLIFYSLLLFFFVFTLNNSSWLSMILTMIFLGGIIMMFMILSSTMPNEKKTKIKLLKLSNLILFILFFCLVYSSSMMDKSFVQDIKMLFFSNQMFEFLLLLIFIYFLSFIFVVSKSTMSLRSFFC